MTKNILYPRHAVVGVPHQQLVPTSPFALVGVLHQQLHALVCVLHQQHVPYYCEDYIVGLKIQILSFILGDVRLTQAKQGHVFTIEC